MKRVISLLFVVLLIFSINTSVYAKKTETSTITLTEKDSVSVDLKLSNAMPGDDHTENLLMNIYHDTKSKITLKFVADETTYMPLTDAYHITIYIDELGKTIYDGTLRGLTGTELIVPYSKKHELHNYTMDLHLSEEIGNEYANKTLAGKFIWTCEGIASPDTPDTGDSYTTFVYLGLLGVALIAIVAIVVVMKRRKNG